MYSFSKINDSSYSQIQALYLDSFNLKTPLENIRKKYATDSFGIKNIGVIALDSDKKPSAYYGVFPIILSYDNKEILVAQSGDTMTSTKHRKKGLFTQLAKKTYQLAGESGIKLIYGFPNENSFPGFKNKLNWQFTGYIYNFNLNILTVPFCEIVSKLPSLKKLYLYYTKFKLQKYLLDVNEIDNFNHSNHKGYIYKNKTFFEYKLNNNDCFLIRIEGFELLIKTDSHLIIGAIGKFETSQTRKLIKVLKKLGKKLGSKKVILSLSENHWLYDRLAKEIKPKKSLPIGFYCFNNEIELNKIEFSGADFDTF